MLPQSAARALATAPLLRAATAHAEVWGMSSLIGYDLTDIKQAIIHSDRPDRVSTDATFTVSSAGAPTGGRPASPRSTPQGVTCCVSRTTKDRWPRAPRLTFSPAGCGPSPTR